MQAFGTQYMGMRQAFTNAVQGLGENESPEEDIPADNLEDMNSLFDFQTQAHMQVGLVNF